ncbi:cobalt/nickel transport protein [Rhodococcus sp. PvR044]|uniref:PDGLE domain-containing protein n=1 Tax=unclassified Rhodococcus (in: high G+C Gram-positive bacteria) TaxID=192944 RepID=UPI001AE219DE|nr:PDGLE domain-containing protein [Rhodococcus sp. PvR099]MBP1161804.1 cobalt/nickel transport protein [Rhodococcus sp. PvR099]
MTSRRSWFLAGFAVVALLIAGVVSYLASSSPDGLDSTTLRGCTVIETAAGEELTGTCIAQHAGEHHLADGPLADYTVAGNDNLSGIAGILGVTATFAVAGGLFWLIARSGRTRRT